MRTELLLLLLLMQLLLLLLMHSVQRILQLPGRHLRGKAAANIPHASKAQHLSLISTTHVKIV